MVQMVVFFFPFILCLVLVVFLRCHVHSGISWSQIVENQNQRTPKADELKCVFLKDSGPPYEMTGLQILQCLQSDYEYNDPVSLLPCFLFLIFILSFILSFFFFCSFDSSATWRYCKACSVQTNAHITWETFPGTCATPIRGVGEAGGVGMKLLLLLFCHWCLHVGYCY
jgi:hypothetical protein